MEYNFEWDPEKARSNLTKHKVSFELGVTVFQDPRALSLYDESHREGEDRWITLGISVTGSLLVVHHTFNEFDDGTASIRIISCRKATRREEREYAG